MVSPILLVAEREFRTYVATLSFWLSLALAPLAASAALLLSPPHAAPPRISIAGGDKQLTETAIFAVREAGRLEGKNFVFATSGVTLDLHRRAPSRLDLDFAPGFPLSETGRALVGLVIERDAAREAASQIPLVVRERAPEVTNAIDAGAQSRLVAMTMLWLTLAGSLGMLLQAVVRERANRALESLLAAAQGWEIVAGKIAGVGAVSLLVLFAWGGTAASLTLIAGSGPLAGIAAGLSDPAMLLRDALIYLCAFAFYGAITVMLGGLARDSASAQNFARPMFVILLFGFLAALSTMGQPSAALSWLVWLPPFTPFLLLVDNPRTVASMSQILPIVLLALASLPAMLMAAKSLSIAPRTGQIFSILGRKLL